jgi:flagellin
MIQTADGALQVIDEKLIRMKELAEQAATGTYTSDQRIIIDSEYQAMMSEITRISMATNFNGISLLDGTLKTLIGEKSPISLPTPNMEFKFDGTYSDSQGGAPATPNNDVTFVSGSQGLAAHLQGVAELLPDTTPMSGGWIDLPAVDFAALNDFSVSLQVKEDSFAIHGAGQYITYGNQVMITKTNSNTLQFLVGGNTLTIPFQDQGISATYTMTRDDQYTRVYRNGQLAGEQASNAINAADLTKHDIGVTRWINNGTPMHRASFIGSVDDLRIYNTALTSDQVESVYSNPNNEKVKVYTDGLKVHFGTGNSSSEDYYYVKTGSSTASSLGISNTNVQTQDSAQSSLSVLDQAIVKKDKIRANLGATQNRLENTISNLQIQAENLQAAESQISDTDVAQEMTTFVREQILSQAAVAMLAQANSMPKMALQLIDGQ